MGESHLSSLPGGRKQTAHKFFRTTMQYLSVCALRSIYCAVGFYKWFYVICGEVSDLSWRRALGRKLPYLERLGVCKAALSLCPPGGLLERATLWVARPILMSSSLLEQTRGTRGASSGQLLLNRGYVGRKLLDVT